MALIKCPECKREGVSDSASACPGCGFPIAPPKAAAGSARNTKARARRISLTPKQLEEAAGIELLAICQDITEDGVIDEQEFRRLEAWVKENRSDGLPAVEYLNRAIEEILEAGALSPEGRRDLYLAVEKVLPKDFRKEAVENRREVEREELTRDRRVETMNFMLAGVSHDGRTELIDEQVHQTTDVFLVPDPTNPHDHNAVIVRTGEGYDIGFVPRDDARRVCSLLREGYKYQAWISKILTTRIGRVPVIIAPFFLAEAQVDGLKGPGDEPAAVIRESASGFGCGPFLLVGLLYLVFALIKLAR